MKDDLKLWRDGVELDHLDVDDNFDRLLYPSGAWIPGSYEQFQAVYHEGGLWVATRTTSQEPTADAADWVLWVPTSGRGEMHLAERLADPPDIIAAYQTLTQFDTQAFSSRGVTLDLVAGTFAFEYPGVWEVGVEWFVEHVDANQGRTFKIRAYNQTAGIPRPGITWGIGRNDYATAVTVRVWLSIDPGLVGNLFRIEYGEASSTIVTEAYNSLAASFLQVSPDYR